MSNKESAGSEQPSDLLALNRLWYWPSEAATIRQVSKATVYRWIESGQITTILTIRPFQIRRKKSSGFSIETESRGATSF